LNQRSLAASLRRLRPVAGREGMAHVYALAGFLAGSLTVLLIRALRPALVRHALARPNARSSHRAPTPQGGGIAVLAGAGLAAAGFFAGGLVPAPAASLALVAVAALTLAVVGACDDIRPMGVLPRLTMQVLAVGIAIHAAGPDVRLLPDVVPIAVERTLGIVAGVWFVNLVNFMDGLDWMTVAEMVPVTAALALFALHGALPADAGLVAVALMGAFIGFAPYNRPVAKLFLGDVGSLPVGLLVAWLLYRLAATGTFAAAILLPLYYCVDATLTLLRRLVGGKPVWQAHRTHFYQRATDHGHSVKSVVAHVFGLNLGLAALAASSFLWRTAAAQAGLVLIGLAAVAFVLMRFSQRQTGLASP